MEVRLSFFVVLGGGGPCIVCTIKTLLTDAMIRVYIYIYIYIYICLLQFLFNVKHIYKI